MHPTGAKDQRPGGRREHGSLTGELGAAIRIDWIDWVGLDIGRCFSAIEHVVRRIVDEPRAALRGEFGELTNGEMVDAIGTVQFAFGLVDPGICAGVDDDVRRRIDHRSFELSGVLEIRVGAAQRHHLANTRQRALQFATDLAGLSEDQEPHFLSTISQPGGAIGTVTTSPDCAAATRATSGANAGPATGGSGKSNRIKRPATRIRTASASLESRGR